MIIDIFTRIIGVNQGLIKKDIVQWEEFDKTESSRVIKIKERAKVAPETDDYKSTQ